MAYAQVLGQAGAGPAVRRESQEPVEEEPAEDSDPGSEAGDV